MNYRKLNQPELEGLYAQLKAHFECSDVLMEEVRDIVIEYFPKTAARVLVKFLCEYDDCDYHRRIHNVIVYDKDGNELFPEPGRDWEVKSEFELCRFTETKERVDRVAFSISKPTLPDLYIHHD